MPKAYAPRDDRSKALLAEVDLGLRKALSWLREEWRKNVAVGSVNRIPFYLREDAGVERRNTDWIADEKVRRLRKGMNW